MNSVVTAVACLQAEFAGPYLTALPYFFNWRPYCEFHNNFAQHVIVLSLVFLFMQACYTDSRLSH